MEENNKNLKIVYEVIPSNDEIAATMYEILANRISKLNNQMKVLIYEYMILMTISGRFLWWMLVTGYLYRYLKKLLKKYFFLLLNILFYCSIVFLVMAFLGGFGNMIYPLSIITEYCYDLLMHVLNSI